MMSIIRFLSMFLLCAASFDASLAKPAAVVVTPEVLNPVLQHAVADAQTDVKRDQRSPQFGFPGEGFDRFEEGFEGGPHRHHGRPEGFVPGGFPPPPPIPEIGASFSSANAESGNVGPFGGGESQANAQSANFNFGGPGEFGRPQGPEASFSQASAGSSNGGGPFGGGGSQANSETANFNFGPYSASFSHSQASSGDRF